MNVFLAMLCVAGTIRFMGPSAFAEAPIAVETFTGAATTSVNIVGYRRSLGVLLE